MTEAAKKSARWVVLAAVVIGGVLLDQITKYLADAQLKGQGLVTVIDGFFELRYARNPGAFFSLGAELSPDVRRLLFVVASTAASILIVRLYMRAQENQRALRWALIFLLTGAIGNLIDRAVQGEVIDFVHLYWRGVLDWATFNVADVFITFGLGLLVVDMLRPRRESAPAKNAPPPSEAQTETGT